MSTENNERIKLSKEIKEPAAYIASLKRTRNKLEAGPEKDRLAQVIKLRQHQALFYVEKSGNHKPSIRGICDLAWN